MHLSRREFIGVTAGLAALPALPQEKEGLVVHEWGVVTVAYGSAGGHVRSAGARRGASGEVPAGLPAFVHTWERAVGESIEAWRNEPVIVDKPVLHFYAPRRMKVSVRVDVPLGRPKAWFPPAADYAPKPQLPNRGRMLQKGGEEPEAPKIEEIRPERGHLHWPDLVVDPSDAELPGADGWWPRARRTDAAIVSRGEARERFLFYDALTPFDPRAGIEWSGDGKVAIRNASDEAFAHVFAVRVRKGECASAYVKSIAPGSTETLAPAAGAPGNLTDVLVERGLARREAEAVVDIWKEEWFGIDGVRVLFVAARAVYDRLLPLAIDPKPAELARVLVAHVECLDDERRARIAGWIEALESNDVEERAAAEASLRREGPLAHAPIRQAIASTKDPDLKARLEALLGR